MKRARYFGLFNFVSASLGSAGLEIRSHKLRSFLSLIGIAIGITSYVTMSNMGEIQKKATKSMIDEIGGLSQVIITQKIAKTSQEGYEYARSPGLRFSDLDSLKANIPLIEKDTRLNMKYQIHFALFDEDYKVGVVGVNRDFLGRIKLLAGRDFTDEEYERGEGVCLVTDNLYKRIKKVHGIDPKTLLGKNLYLTEGFPLRIIGFFEKPMNMGWSIYRNGLFVPIRFWERNVGGVNQPREQLYLQLRSADKNEEGKAQIATLLTSLHRGVRDFYFEARDWAGDMDKNMKKVSLTFAIITLISLLVGGLNIMNVMLVSISTRVWEIGMRKAVGASHAQIFAQFLIESSVLSMAGGLLGMIAGYFTASIAAGAIAQGIPWFIPSFNNMVLVRGALISVAIGIIFGLYPALKAFRLNPTAALHYE